MRAMLWSTISLVLAVGACGGTESPSEPGARLAINVAPLTLEGVSDVTYTLWVTNGAATVWTKTLTSSKFGDGKGALSYVGPCDASAATNDVHLTIDTITGTSGPLADWKDPGELVQTASCVANSDTAVMFDVTIARQANQGFFDVAVSFDDIFCSAKLDCTDALLFHGNDRATTLVVAFACTTGNGTTTVLDLDSIALTCTDGTTYIDPALGPGSTHQTSTHVFDVATYRDNESLPPYQKAFWNTAIGLDLASFQQPSTVDCTLTTHATAAQTTWADGQTPLGSVWPYIDWNVQVVNDGLLSCTEHKLDVPGSGVKTIYAVPPNRPRFGASMEASSCDDDACDVVRNGHVCSGQLAGVTGPVVFAGTPNGVIVTVNGQSTAALPLPNGYSLTGCCADPCCGNTP